MATTTAMSTPTGNYGGGASSLSVSASSSSCYPRSRLVSSYPLISESIVRSRVWSEDIVKGWDDPMTGLESLEDRVERYLRYFTLTTDQKTVILNKLSAEISQSLEDHSQGRAPSNSLHLLESYVASSELRSSKRATSVAVALAGGVVKSGAVTIQGAGHPVTVASSCVMNLRQLRKDKHPRRGLLEMDATATDLFDAIVERVPLLLPKKLGFTGSIGMSVAFPMVQRGIRSGTLFRWTRNMVTGRTSDDPVEGGDLAVMFECGLARKQQQDSSCKFDQCSVKSVLNDAVATLVAGYYETSGHHQQQQQQQLQQVQKSLAPPPMCRMAIVLDVGFNAAMILADAASSGFTGDVVNMELGNFDNSLPMNDVDLEIDFADAAGQGKQLLEKMVGMECLGEICRRVIVKVWQDAAPVLAWKRRTMPWEAASKIVADESVELAVTGEILKSLWDWNTNIAIRVTVQKLWDAVFSRAAALTAISIVGIAKHTGFCQAAMGGVTCALGGELVERLPTFVKRIESHVQLLLPQQPLITFYLTSQAQLKGAGILAALL